MTETELRGLICKRGPMTDGSGTCTGSTKQVFAANVNRRYLLLQNQSGVVVYVNFGASASAGAGSIKLDVGASLFYEGGFVPTDAVAIYGGNGAAYTAKEG